MGKKHNPEFDVTMASNEGADLPELVGLYLLDQLTKELNKIFAFTETKV